MPPSITRWFRVLGLTLVGIFVFELSLPLAWDLLRSVETPYTSFFRDIIVSVFFLLLFYFATQPIRIPRDQWRWWLRYPPTWLVVPLSLVFVGARNEWCPFGFRPWAVGPDWPYSFPMAWSLAVLMIVAILIRRYLFRQPIEIPAHARVHSREDITWTDVKRWIDAGERPLESYEPDFFRHRPVAQRMVQMLGCRGGPVALLGAFGTGKSSILNTVRSELAEMVPQVIVATVDVWAAGKPEDVPRLALNQIIIALDDYIDTIELRGLPRSYKRLVAAMPPGLLVRGLGVDQATDSMKEIERLSPILDALNTSLVLIVEDIERAGSAFELRHLERFLWAFRRLNRCAFAVAVDPVITSIDFSKLCDTIERVPTLRPEHVAKVLVLAYDHWSSAYSDIDPHPSRSSGNKFQLHLVRSPDKIKQMEESGSETFLGTLVSLLQTPRALKHFVSHVNRSWTKLHGEAELDDIIILSALRHGAPQAFTFLLVNIDAARGCYTEDMPRILNAKVLNVKDDWKALLKSEPKARAVQYLVNLLRIDQLIMDSAPEFPRSPQGVYLVEPVDYFSRVVAQELAPSEVRDQGVLRHIDRWKSGERSLLVEGLTLTSDVDQDYVNIWQHFADMHTKSDLIALTQLVVARMCENGGASASGDHPALSALRRAFNRVDGQGESVKWLTDLITSVVPVSLVLVDGLLYFWTGANEVICGTSTGTVQRVVKSFRLQLQSTEDLVRVLSKKYPASIRDFTSIITTIKGSVEFEMWCQYFESLIIKGVRLHRHMLFPELVNLALENGQPFPLHKIGTSGSLNQATIDRQRLKMLFKTRLDEVLMLLSESEGTDSRTLRAKSDASEWLRERTKKVEKR